MSLPGNFLRDFHVQKTSLRKRRVFSGKRARRLQMEKRRTMQVEVRRRKTTTTWSSVECVKMEGSCCAVTPAPLRTTSTALTHPCLRFRTESGSVRVVLWVTDATRLQPSHEWKWRHGRDLFINSATRVEIQADHCRISKEIGLFFFFSIWKFSFIASSLSVSCFKRESAEDSYLALGRPTATHPCPTPTRPPSQCSRPYSAGWPTREGILCKVAEHVLLALFLGVWAAGLHTHTHTQPYNISYSIPEEVLSTVFSGYVKLKDSNAASWASLSSSAGTALPGDV